MDGIALLVGHQIVLSLPRLGRFSRGHCHCSEMRCFETLLPIIAGQQLCCISNV